MLVMFSGDTMMPQLHITLTAVVDVPENVAKVPSARIISDPHIGLSIFKPNNAYGVLLWSGKGMVRVTGVTRDGALPEEPMPSKPWEPSQ